MQFNLDGYDTFTTDDYGIGAPRLNLRSKEEAEATNQTFLAQTAQQQAQPAGGYFQDDFPEPVGVRAIARSVTQAEAAPSTALTTNASPVYQTYFDAAGQPAIGARASAPAPAPEVAPPPPPPPPPPPAPVAPPPPPPTPVYPGTWQQPGGAGPGLSPGPQWIPTADGGWINLTPGSGYGSVPPPPPPAPVPVAPPPPPPVAPPPPPPPVDTPLPVTVMPRAITQGPEYPMLAGPVAPPVAPPPPPPPVVPPPPPPTPVVPPPPPPPPPPAPLPPPVVVAPPPPPRYTPLGSPTLDDEPVRVPRATALPTVEAPVYVEPLPIVNPEMPIVNPEDIPRGPRTLVPTIDNVVPVPPETAIPRNAPVSPTETVYPGTWQQPGGAGPGQRPGPQWIPTADGGWINMTPGSGFVASPAPAPTPAPPPAPTPAPPPAPTPVVNAYGNTANLDPAYLEQQIRAAFAAIGRTPTPEEIAYWIGKASTPDIYSDGQVRVGWNPYWADRIRTGLDSSDPRLAGTEGIIQNPENYGYALATRPDGLLDFERDRATWATNAPGATLGAAGTMNTLGAPGFESPLETLADLGITPPSAPAPPPPPIIDPAEAARWTTLMDQIMGRLDPNTAGLKESQKETLLAAQARQREAALQAAAARGTLGAGTLAATDAALGSDFAGNLTRAYRDIDMAGEREGFSRRAQLAQMERQAQDTAAQMGLNWAQLKQQDRQFFVNMELQKAVATQNANMDFIRLLLGMLG